MADQLRALVAGNWKMNGLKASLDEIDALVAKIGIHPDMKCDMIICPSSILLCTAVKRAENFEIGAQNCHAAFSGAYTGDISTEMLTDIGVTTVILGHSERRNNHAESSHDICIKVAAAQRAGLLSIVCVGETIEERKAGRALSVVSQQISESLPEDGSNADNIVIAYEPVWAIGTGLNASTDDIKEMHQNIRDLLKGMFERDGDKMRILYGGSVNGGNAKELMAVPNVNGALVGGASLKADSFFEIVTQAYL